MMETLYVVYLYVYMKWYWPLPILQNNHCFYMCKCLYQYNGSNNSTFGHRYWPTLQACIGTYTRFVHAFINVHFYIFKTALVGFLLNFVTDHNIFTISISMKGKIILLQLVLELLAPRKEIDCQIEINTSTIYDLVIQWIYEVSFSKFLYVTFFNRLFVLSWFWYAFLDLFFEHAL